MINRELYIIRLRIIQEIRNFFSSHDYLEVETPLLSEFCIPESTIPLFRTVKIHPWEEQQMLQLLPSPEYYMKQLLAMGWGSMFQIGKSFRNGENIGKIHNSEFTMLEYYGLKIDYIDSMKLTEDLIAHICTRCSPAVCPDKSDFARMTMEEAFRKYENIELTEFCGTSNDPHNTAELERTKSICSSIGIQFSDSDDWEILFNRVFLNRIEPRLESEEVPLFLYNYPAKLQSLSRNIEDSPWTERWELYWKGIELANCYSEETRQQRVEDFFSNEIQAMARSTDPDMLTQPDMEFPAKIACLPRCSGTAMGLDRLIMILCAGQRISDVRLF